MCTITLLTGIHQTPGRAFQTSGPTFQTPGRTFQTSGRVFKTQTQTHLSKSATVYTPPPPPHRTDISSSAAFENYYLHINYPRYYLPNINT